jgi:hypothetical protein
MRNPGCTYVCFLVGTAGVTFELVVAAEGLCVAEVSETTRDGGVLKEIFSILNCAFGIKQKEGRNNKGKRNLKNCYISANNYQSDSTSNMVTARMKCPCLLWLTKCRI